MKALIKIGILFFFSISNICGQSVSKSVIASGGKENVTSTFVLYSNIGEVASTTLLSSSVLTQGFEQPEGIITSNVSENSNPSDYAISIFPNPATSEIVISNSKNKEFQIKICDIQGQLIESTFNELSNKRYEVDLSRFRSGIYFISIIDSVTKLLVANYKLVKL
jgi:hypothetical protein